MASLQDAQIRSGRMFTSANFVVSNDIAFVYARASRHRVIQGQRRLVLELANIVVAEKSQGRGVGRAIIECFEDVAKKYQRGVFVELVHNPILGNCLERRGYTLVPGTEDDAPSYYKDFRA